MRFRLAFCGILLAAIACGDSSAPSTVALTVVRAGTGSGVVISSPSGINCGVDCSESYNHGTAVTLTPTPLTGSTFAGWSGAACSAASPTRTAAVPSGPCVVTITAATTVTATFTLNQ